MEAEQRGNNNAASSLAKSGMKNGVEINSQLQDELGFDDFQEEE